MKYVEQSYETEKNKVHFEQMQDIYLSKDGYHVGVLIKVFEKNLRNGELGLRTIYSKKFENMISSSSYHNFVKKFLENPEYRKRYLEEGKHWNEVIIYANSKGVNNKCVRLIESLNKKGENELTEKDFINLKTFGDDDYTRMNYTRLLCFIAKNDLDKVTKEFQDVKTRNMVIRWVARGLKTAYAIKKVKVDNHIASMS